MSKQNEAGHRPMKQKPAQTPEEREKQLTNMAYDYAEKLFREGKASSQVTTYFLKMGSEKERMEKEKLEKEVELLRAKTEALEQSKEIGESYQAVISAIMHYRGVSSEEDFND